ncbi:MAG TPA: sugar ABC transporter permease [Aggregatilineales bacterium]|nr:sugar ABC transporter permease [Aggregatilineales bacterium]
MARSNTTTAALPLTAAAPNRRNFDLASRQRRWGWLFLSPWILGFVVFTAAPILASLYFTFTNFNLGSPDKIQFVGLQNWGRLFTDPDNLQAMSVTLRFALMAIPVGILGPILMASILHAKNLKARRFWTTLFYMPYIIPAVSAAFVWRAFLNGDSGWLNRILRLIGIANPPSYLQDPNWILPAFLMVGVWSFGNAMLLTLASMQSVPTELYEAAQVDGANGWIQFRNITLPMISPVIFYNLVLTVISLMQYFTIPYVMTAGNGNNTNAGDPAKSALFMNLYLYKTGFTYLDMGYAATQAWIIFLMGLGLTAILFATAPLWVYYAGGDL